MPVSKKSSKRGVRCVNSEEKTLNSTIIGSPFTQKYDNVPLMYADVVNRRPCIDQDVEDKTNQRTNIKKLIKSINNPMGTEETDM